MSYNKIIEELIAENEKLKSNINLNLARNFELQKENKQLKEQNKTSYKPHEVFKLKQENEETKEIINNFREQNFELREDLGTYKNQYNKLFDEHEQLKQRIKKLVSKNTTLQNDLFSEQLLQDETDDYINKIKNELFNAYLKQQQQERLISELKLALSSYNNFVDEMFPD